MAVINQVFLKFADVGRCFTGGFNSYTTLKSGSIRPKEEAAVNRRTYWQHERYREQLITVETAIRSNSSPRLSDRQHQNFTALEVVAKSIKALHHKGTKSTRKSFSFPLCTLCLCGSLLFRALCDSTVEKDNGSPCADTAKHQALYRSLRILTRLSLSVYVF